MKPGKKFDTITGTFVFHRVSLSHHPLWSLSSAVVHARQCTTIRGCNTNFPLLDECKTLWGEPERLHMNNMEQLHAHDCHQNVTEHSTTSGKSSHTQPIMVDTAHWSNTPCALQKCRLRSGVDRWSTLSVLIDVLAPLLLAMTLKRSAHMTSDFNAGIVSQATLQVTELIAETFLPHAAALPFLLSPSRRWFVARI